MRHLEILMTIFSTKAYTKLVREVCYLSAINDLTENPRDNVILNWGGGFC